MYHFLLQHVWNCCYSLKLRKEQTWSNSCGSRIGLATKWNSSAGRANGTKEAAKELNAFLDTLKTKVYEAQRKLVDEGEVLTTDTIREIITGRNRNANMLLEVSTTTTIKCVSSCI